LVRCPDRGGDDADRELSSFGKTQPYEPGSWPSRAGSARHCAARGRALTSTSRPDRPGEFDPDMRALIQKNHPPHHHLGDTAVSSASRPRAAASASIARTVHRCRTVARVRWPGAGSASSNSSRSTMARMGSVCRRVNDRWPSRVNVAPRSGPWPSEPQARPPATPRSGRHRRSCSAGAARSNNGRPGAAAALAAASPAGRPDHATSIRASVTLAGRRWGAALAPAGTRSVRLTPHWPHSLGSRRVDHQYLTYVTAVKSPYTPRKER